MKTLISLILCASIFFAVPGCRGEGEEKVDIMEFEEWNNRLVYSMHMYFYGSIGGRRWGWEPAMPEDDSARYVHIVFVHREEDAVSYSDDVDVSVLWPSDITVNLVYYINLRIERDGIDIEQFSLQYPLTIENVVDDWGKVLEFWQSLPSVVRETLHGNAKRLWEEQQQERESAEIVTDEEQYD